MPWSFPGITNPVECVYTQHTGFAPDTASLLCNPQPTNIPTLGTLTLQWGATTITLPQCTIDVGSVRYSTQGRHLQLSLKDRREFWRRVAPISGSYNTIRAGEYVARWKKNLRQLGRMLMDALGETTAIVDALPNTVYPQVDWQCESVVDAAEALFHRYGFSVTLGFGTEPVRVVRLGEAEPVIDTTNMFSASETLDPKIIPRYIRVCFGPTLRQLRLKLEAVGQEIGGDWKLIDDLSYTPISGWEATAPYSLPEVDQAEDTETTESELAEATGYVRRAYRVKGFADGTWDRPLTDPAVTVEGLPDILPLQNRVLDTEDVRPDSSYQPFRIYGRHFKIEQEEAAPAEPVATTTTQTTRVHQRHVWFDGENGIVIFEKPMFWVDRTVVPGGEWKPADLWLECVTTIRDQTTNAFDHYHVDIEIDPTGTGYHTVDSTENRLEEIYEYSPGGHVESGVQTNKAVLDALATSIAMAAAASFQTAVGRYIAYSIPKLAVRCTGAVLQVQHILTCGEHEHAVNRTIISTHHEFDRGIPTRMQRIAHASALYDQRKTPARDLRQVRGFAADD